MTENFLRCHVEVMLATQQSFAARYGYFFGNTSAACISVASTLAARRPASHKVLTIAYDHGLWYA